jgi:hypothetical protein
VRRSTACTQRLETMAEGCNSFGREFYPSVPSQISFVQAPETRPYPTNYVCLASAFSFDLGSLRHLIPPGAGYRQPAHQPQCKKKSPETKCTLLDNKVPQRRLHRSKLLCAGNFVFASVLPPRVSARTFIEYVMNCTAEYLHFPLVPRETRMLTGLEIRAPS